MKYKWCVCDMDGTLLNSRSKISEKNEKALIDLQNNGTEVIIASGRTDLLMKPYIKQLDLKGYIICNNGAMIKHIESQEIIYSKYLEKKAVQLVIKYCMDNRLDFLVYTKDTVYSNETNPRAKQFKELDQSLPEELRVPIVYFSYDDFSLFDSLDIIKILISEENEELLNSYGNYFSQFPNLSAVSSAKGLMDIWTNGVSKGTALKALAEELNINLEQVVAFGDNYNDLEMFKVAGVPIAMENAVDELKLLAKHITKSNDEDGVAYAWDVILK